MRVSLPFLPRLVRRFARDERGVISAHNLLLTIVCCSMGALGMDVTYLYAARTELQVAADIGAHSAIFLRYQGKSPDEAKTGAIAAVQFGMPQASYGDVLSASDIVFGTWDLTERAFTALPANSTALPTAVRVVTNRADDNPVGNLFLRILGIDATDVRAATIYSASAGDPCASMQGMFGKGDVKPNSNNSFSAGLCVHSQTKATVQSDPIFVEGSHISAPNLADVTCQNKCTGFDAARRSADYDLEQWLGPLRLTGALAAETHNDLLADVKAALPDWNWTGINQNITTITLPKSGEIRPGDVTGQVVYIDCRSSSGTAELAGTYTRTVFLLHDCPASVKKKSDVILSDSIIYTTSTSPKNSIQFSGSGMRIGADPNCTGTGRGALLTRGGFNTAAGTTFKNGIVRALGSISFAAQFGSSDTSGMSVIAGGEVDTTSNSVFNACPSDPDAPPVLPTFALVQ